MTEPFSTVCDHCNATLKLKNPDLVGKKIKCPKCGEAFVVAGTPAVQKKAVKKKVAADDDFLDFDAGDYESPPDDADLDEEEDRPARRSRPVKTTKKKGKKSSKGKGNATQILMIGAIVLVLFAVLGGGGYGLMVLAKAASSDVDWLPTEIDGFARLQPNGIWNSAAVQPLTSSDFGKHFVDEMTKTVGMGPQDIDQIIVGFPKGGRPGSEVTVVRSKIPFDLSKLQGSAGTVESVSHAGLQYSKNGTAALFLADSKTLIRGPEATIKDVMSRGRQNPSASKFGFARGYRDQVVVAVTNPSAANPSASSTGMMGFGSNQMQDAETILIRANASSNVTMSIQTKFKTADAAKGVLDKTQADLNQGRTQLTQQKSQILAMPANPLVKLDDAKKIFESMEQVMNSIKVSQSGTQVSMQLDVSGQVIKDVTELIKSSPFAQMLGVGGFPPLFRN